MRCPKCSSENVQIHYDVQKQGFSDSKSCCGLFLLGPIGLLCGLCGSNKVKSEEKYWLCNNCGKKFTEIEGLQNEKLLLANETLSNAESNFFRYDYDKNIVNKKVNVINTLKNKLNPDDLKRFVFDPKGADQKAVIKILKTYIKPNAKIDLSNECIYFMYNESTIGDQLGTIFTNRGIYHPGTFANLLFTPSENISEITISGKDIKIETQSNKFFLDFAKIKEKDSFVSIAEILNTLYLE